MKNQMTNIEEIKSLISNIEPLALMSAISQMDNIYVPQAYIEDHAEMYGFDSLEEMKEMGNYYTAYEQVDEIMRNISYEKED